MPIARAAPSERSKLLPRVNGPRSLTVTLTLLPSSEPDGTVIHFIGFVEQIATSLKTPPSILWAKPLRRSNALSVKGHRSQRERSAARNADDGTDLMGEEAPVVTGGCTVGGRFFASRTVELLLPAIHA
jgi:hypothetical protein